MNEFRKLAIANAARQQEWDPNNKVTIAYRGNELAGEVGEACNVLKKLERERLGIRGSRATKEQAAEELADVIICASLIANDLSLDLWPAVIAKFNKTSEAYSLETKLEAERPPMECEVCHRLLTPDGACLYEMCPRFEEALR